VRWVDDHIGRCGHHEEFLNPIGRQHDGIGPWSRVIVHRSGAHEDHVETVEFGQRTPEELPTAVAVRFHGNHDCSPPKDNLDRGTDGINANECRRCRASNGPVEGVQLHDELDRGVVECLYAATVSAPTARHGLDRGGNDFGLFNRQLATHRVVMERANRRSLDDVKPG